MSKEAVQNRGFCHVANPGCKCPPGHGAGRAGYYTCRPGRDPTTSRKCSKCREFTCDNELCSPSDLPACAACNEEDPQAYKDNQ